MTKFLIGLVALILGNEVSLASELKSQELKCPEQITVHSKAQEIPTGWFSWDEAVEGKNAIKKLSSIGIYEGHPSKKVLLAPDNADSKDSYRKWTFIPYGEKQKSPIWIACQYEDTQMLVVKSLQMKIQKCRMEFVTTSSSKKHGPINCD